MSRAKAAILAGAGSHSCLGPVCVDGAAQAIVIDRVSVASDGTQGNGNSGSVGSSYPSAWASADGRYVAFTSEATNLVGGDTNGVSDVFVRDRDTGTTTRVSVTTGGAQGNGGTYWLSSAQTAAM